jgi:catechol 2,3-dioxygenase-like lactoylglutathione lyase family enzyme
MSSLWLFLHGLGKTRPRTRVCNCIAAPRPVGINHVALEVDDVENALTFWRKVFGELNVVHEPGAAFIDLGDQFVALMGPDAPIQDRERHFGLVVDDKEATRRALATAGAEILPGRRLDAHDPFGNRIQVVQYDQIQFTKSPEVLRAMALELTKTAAVLEELRASGVDV